jgi:hypothetical protein
MHGHVCACLKRRDVLRQRHQPALQFSDSFRKRLGIDRADAADPVISGTQAGQATTDDASIKPFASVSITDPNPGSPVESVTVVPSLAADGGGRAAAPIEVSPAERNVIARKRRIHAKRSSTFADRELDRRQPALRTPRVRTRAEKKRDAA